VLAVAVALPYTASESASTAAIDSTSPGVRPVALAAYRYCGSPGPLLDTLVEAGLREFVTVVRVVVSETGLLGTTIAASLSPR
jgi:hypothetical protein